MPNSVSSQCDPSCTIHHIPPEILALIFEANATDASDDRPAIFSSHVCRFWRNIALATPQLWTRICIGSGHAMEFCMRSRPLPVHIYMVPAILDVGSWLPQYSGRIASITPGHSNTHVTNNTILAILSNIGPHSPLLSHLDLIGDSRPIRDETHTAALDLSHLTCLKLTRFSLRTWENIGNLTSLELWFLDDMCTYTSLSMAEFFGILKRSPRLQILHLGLLSLEGPPGPTSHHNIELTHIESFKIQSIKHISKLMSHLHIPSSAPILDLCRNIAIDSFIGGLLTWNSISMPRCPFRGVPPSHILNVHNKAVWFGYNIRHTSFFFVDQELLEGPEFIGNFGAAIDLSQITLVKLSLEYPSSVTARTDVWKTFLDQMPLLSYIHLRTKHKWLNTFILILWPDMEPVDINLSHRVKNVAFEMILGDIQSDPGVLSDFLIERLQSRLHVVGSPLEKLVINFAVDGILERMNGLVTDFVTIQ